MTDSHSRRRRRSVQGRTSKMRYVAYSLILIVFGISYYSILMSAKEVEPKAAMPVLSEPIVGPLNISAIDRYAIGAQAITLCGVAYTKPNGLREIYLDAARVVFQGKQVTCKMVGAGTPCDGRSAASFAGTIVAQCMTSDGTDIAAYLSARGMLCDLPGQSGGAYTACKTP